MICRLCLFESTDAINIFHGEGLEMKVAEIVSQHFWFQPKEDDPISKCLCYACWWKIESFHTFYLTIEEAHRKLSERFCLKSDPHTVQKTLNKLKVEHQEHKSDVKEVIAEPELENSTAEKEEAIEEYEFEDEPDDLDADTTQDDEPKDEKFEVPTEVAREISNEIAVPRRSSRYLAAQESISEFIKVKSQSPAKKRKQRATTEGTRGRKSKRKCTELMKPNEISQPDGHLSDDDTAKPVSEYLKKSQEDNEKIARYMKLKCEICSNEYSLFADIRKHYRTVHKRKGYVVCCNKKLYKRVLILDHINKHLNPEYFKCEICNKTFSDKQCLKNHMIQHESDDAKTFKCKDCPRRYAKQYLLDQHKLIHMPVEERQYFCNECKKAFPTKNLLQTHKRYVHENAYGNMCHICAKVIRGKALFEKHQLEHAGVVEPKVQCKECGAWLKHEYSLKKHMRRHLESMSDHICNICGKMTPSKGALRSHVRYCHSSERAFQCSVCNKAFKKGISLKEHMTTHTGEVLYTCPHCPKTFNSSANMHSHRKKVHRQEWEESRRNRGIPSQQLAEAANNPTENEENTFVIFFETNFDNDVQVNATVERCNLIQPEENVASDKNISV